MTIPQRIRRIGAGFWRDESGQSSFFAALTLFLLVTAIGYSYNVSLVVSRRVRLQNAADAAALSGAMVEANALAAIAWLNGCETYIHARMQEVMLDIPYPATAAATAEWGRYVKNRYGWGDLNQNPVEMNHGTNKKGFFGLFDQLMDLFKGIGGLFSGGNQSDEDAEKVEKLVDEYFDKDTSKKRKDEIAKELKDKYGVDVNVGGLDLASLQEVQKEVERTHKEFEDARDAYLARENQFRTKGVNGKTNYGCSEATDIRSKMLAVGDNVRRGLEAEGKMTKYENRNTYQYVIDGKDTVWLVGWHTSNGEDIDSYIAKYESNVKKTTKSIEGIDEDIVNLDDSIAKESNAAKKQTLIEERNALMAERTKKQGELDANEQCLADLKALKTECEDLEKMVKDVAKKGEAFQKATEKMESKSKEITDGSTEMDVDEAKRQRDIIIKEYENQRREPVSAEDMDIDRSMFLNSYNDPPEPWALFKMVPVPLFNPYGPNIHMGRMTPLGTPLSELGIGGNDYAEEKDVVRDTDLNKKLSSYSGKDKLTDGLPPWDELKTAFAGPFGKFIWPEVMRMRYGLSSPVDDIDSFFSFFHGTLVKEAKKWIGYRKTEGNSLSPNQGIRPGELWIRQLSQIAAAIATAMPGLVRNEVVYSLAVNASPRARVAIFPDPEEKSLWGDVAFAQTDADAGTKFFRYDGWFNPPHYQTEDKHPTSSWWMPPPNYVNIYTMANALSPSVEAAVTINNRAVWSRADNPDFKYANRFLNESRRQNMRMRTASFSEVGADIIQSRIDEQLDKLGVVGKYVGNLLNIDEIIAGIKKFVEEIFPVATATFPTLAYSMLVNENDLSRDHRLVKDTAQWRPAYFRMNYDKSFYWDEYAGRVGGWDMTDGPGSPVRVAVQCWNQNDRVWRQPITDSKNNNKLFLDLLDGLSNSFTMVPLTIPFPFSSGHYSFNNSIEHIFDKSQLNFNLSPRCQIGYAPGSNVFGLGHAMFIPSHGDPGDAFGAADGHWHFMHYHAHSIGCQVGYPGMPACYAIVNCIFFGAINFMLKGLMFMGDDLGPVNRRVGYDSTMHFPYKHWDGTIADDGYVAKDGNKEHSQTRHIYCRVSTGNNFASKNQVWNTIEKLLGHGEGRQPPFTINLNENLIWSLIPPLSLYLMVDPCPQIEIQIFQFKLTICKHFDQHLVAAFSEDGLLDKVGLHDHTSCGDMIPIPKDIVPFYNTPVFWNWGDSDPSILSMWGAFLNTGDMEGDFFMGLGSGDRFFYPEILYRLTDGLGNLISRNNAYATGRTRYFTQMNNPVAWFTEIAGTGIGVLGALKNAIEGLDFLKGLSGVLGKLQEFGEKLLDNEIFEMLGGGSFNIFGDEFTDDSLPDRKLNTVDYYRSDSIFNELFSTVVDLVSRWGHHRFMTCPLCMSLCPLGCDYHYNAKGDPESSQAIRHWGGDYGGAGTFDLLPARGADFPGLVGLYYKAIGFMSILPGLLSTGDQRSDAGMSYNNVLRGHDYSPVGKSKKDGNDNPNWWGEKKGKDTKGDKIPKSTNSYFDLGVDLDDGLQGNGPISSLAGEARRAWENKFPLDRFVREWMSPRSSESASPDLRLAPTVVVTENFMRHGLTVAVVEEYTPMLWMFGKSRPMLAVATAKCGFIERPAVYVGDERIVIDGLGVGPDALPQIITGIGEVDGGADSGNGKWDLNALWDNFLDFPNKRPLGESNLYYGNWGAKLIPTRNGILINAGGTTNTTNPRRHLGNQESDQTRAHKKLWTGLGRARCYRGDGAIDSSAARLYSQCRMTLAEWDTFADQIVDTAEGF